MLLNLDVGFSGWIATHTRGRRGNDGLRLLGGRVARRGLGFKGWHPSLNNGDGSFRGFVLQGLQQEG